MSRMIRIAVLANAGLGGTEKAATIYAAELVSRGYHVDYLASPGPRTKFLTANRVNVLHVGRSADEFLNYFRERRPQIIHQHVPGYPTDSQLYAALDRIAVSERPKLIETNVFGRLEDPDSAGMVDFRFFISAASAAQAFRRAGIHPTAETLGRQTVLYYPVTRPDDSVSTIDPEVRRNLRAELNVKEDETLAVRIGRPVHKWAAWECEAHAIARRRSPQLRLFLMEPPPWLAAEISRGKYGNGIIVRKETSDFAWLEKLYASADLMIHASDWGESFGYTIAEGMAAELPVITRSTPWCDNAQVELVKNGETGFVCWSVPEMARRLMELASHTTKRSGMGTAAQRRISLLADPENETDLLELAIASCLGSETDSKLVDRNMELLDFIKRFPKLERTTSETCSQHPVDFAAAFLYSLYRRLRAQLRATLNRRLRPTKIATR